MFLKAGLLRRSPTLITKLFRTFLSEQYKCTTEWNSRLSAPFMQKANLDNLFYEIDQTFQQKGKASAIDIDIFVNKVTDKDGHADEISDLLYKLRLTEETSNTLDSTSHAVVRNYADMDNIKELLAILNDRLSYGVFLDHYIASYILNILIKKKDLHSAAQIASLLMLQEDFENPLSRALSLYACYNYLSNPEPFYPQKAAAEGSEEPKEVVKVRVKYLRNEFYDDHFDIKDQYHLVGKTLAMIGSQTSEPFNTSIQLLGYTLHQKYEKALEIIKNTQSPLFKDLVQKSLEFLEKQPQSENESYEKLKSFLEQLVSTNKLHQANFEAELENYVKSTVSKTEAAEIENQKKVYLEWNQIREQKLNDEFERLKRVQRLKEIEKIADNMKKEEQKLWFFENEEKIELQIDSKKVYYPKRWFGKKKKPRVIDEGYVPPEIVKHRK